MWVTCYHDNVMMYVLVLLPEWCGSSFAGDVQTCGTWRGAPSCGERAEHNAKLAEGITTPRPVVLNPQDPPFPRDIIRRPSYLN